MLFQIDSDLNMFDTKNILHSKMVMRKINAYVGIAFLILSTMLGKITI